MKYYVFLYINNKKEKEKSNMIEFKNVSKKYGTGTEAVYFAEYSKAADAAAG